MSSSAPASFYQAGEFYRALDAGACTRRVNNFSGDLKQVRSAEVRAENVANLRQAGSEYGDRVAALVSVK